MSEVLEHQHQHQHQQVPKGYRVFCKYRGDPLVFEHDPMPYVIDDPLFEWGAKDFLSSRLPLSISYVVVYYIS